MEKTDERHDSLLTEGEFRFWKVVGDFDAMWKFEKKVKA